MKIVEFILAGLAMILAVALGSMLVYVAGDILINGHILFKVILVAFLASLVVMHRDTLSNRA